MLAPRYLPWAILAAGGGLLVAAWTAGSLRTTAAPAGPGQPAARGADHAREKHYVGPRQLADSNAMVSREVDAMWAAAHDGRRVGWDDLSGGRPVALVFIKEGCPCNAEVEPFFHRVEELYRAEVGFASVIDAGAEGAARYAAEQKVLHPVLADPERQLIRLFRAENGCYVVLLTPGRVIDGFWPGCSADTMRQLGRRIAGLAGVAERPLDVSGMPASLTTGCPFRP